jgi:hypothetical protein
VDGTLVLVHAASGPDQLYELSATNPVLIGSSALTFSVSSLTATAFGQSLISAANAAAARALLGAIGGSELQGQTYTAFTTAGSGTAYTLTPDPAITAYTAGQSFWVNFHAVSGLNPTITISGVATPPNLVKQIANGTYANVAATDIPVNHRGRVTLLSSSQALVELPSAKSGANSDITELSGLTTPLSEVQGGTGSTTGPKSKIQSITASVASNALTITVNPTTLDFRSATLGSGTVNTRTLASAASLVISFGSTLGASNAQGTRIAVLLIDNPGTLEVAAVNLAGGVSLDETGVITTVAEGGAGGADSATSIYSITARTGVPYRVVGYVDSTQATAGTYATAPSAVQGVGGQALAALSSFGFGQTLQTLTGSRSYATPYANFTNKPIWVLVYGTAATSVTLSFSLNGGTNTVFAACSLPSGTAIAVGGFFVPPGFTYTVSGPGTPTAWSEMR